MLPRDAASLAERVLRGDRRAIARTITLAENRDVIARDIMTRLYAHTGQAHVIGITGPPGAGKSTLTDHLIDRYRQEGLRVAVLAVDPTSPFTGGAILGDRVRMQRRSTDQQAFVRSMATRGHLGGISRATADAARILDAAGNHIIIIETVGVGQAEVDIVRLADTICVIAVPGMGDDIQAIKAGLMEIGDIFVLNKADRDGADKTYAELKTWLEMDHDETGWFKPLIRTTAATGTGIDEVIAATRDHLNHLTKHQRLAHKRRLQAEHEILDIIREHATTQVLTKQADEYANFVEQVAERQTDPYSAADALTNK